MSTLQNMLPKCLNMFSFFSFFINISFESVLGIDNTEKWFWYKRFFSRQAEYFLHFVRKSRLFLAGGGLTPPLIGNMSPKKSSFLRPPSKANPVCLWTCWQPICCSYTSYLRVHLFKLIPCHWTRFAKPSDNWFNVVGIFYTFIGNKTWLFSKNQLFEQSHSVDLCTDNRVLFFEEFTSKNCRLMGKGFKNIKMRMTIGNNIREKYHNAYFFFFFLRALDEF